jgi:prepilin-type N-terminal cleavage/methylation domain-containing protein
MTTPALHLSRRSVSGRGFTLVEVLAAIGILGLLVGFVGTGIFQTLRVERQWKDDVLASKETRNAGSWFGRDAPNAESADLLDGGPASSAVQIDWTGADGAPISVTYQLSGDQLTRSESGGQVVVARSVISVAFTRNGQVLTMTVTVRAAGGAARSQTLNVYARNLS